MSWDFDRLDILVVRARFWGPKTSALAYLALDTAATSTLLDPEILEAIGIDLSRPLTYCEMSTGSRFERVPRYVVPRVDSLSVESTGLVVTGHRLPDRSRIDGL